MKTIHKPGLRPTLTQAIAGLGRGVIRVGWFPGAQYDNGMPVATIAAIQEFGSGPIPPRSFMRSTATAKRNQWRAVAAQQAKQILNGKVLPKAGLELLGEVARGDVAETISRLTDPPLAPATIYARQHRAAGKNTSTKPLVDSGRMLATLAMQVENK